MASSYVEVRESENGAEGSILQFEIDPCENNGINVPQHIEGEPPKDHTYNKEPEIMELDDSGSVIEEKELEVKNDDDETLKKSNKGQKNAKQKTGKSRTGESFAKSPVKRDVVKRIVARKVNEEAEEEVIMKDEEHEVKNDVTHEVVTDAKDTVIAASHVPKKRGRKRKAHDNSFDEIHAEQSKVSGESITENGSVNKKEIMVEKEGDPPVKVASNETNQQKAKKTKDKTLRQAKEVESKHESSKEVKKNTIESKHEFTSEKKIKDVGEHDTSLPAGWTRKLVERKSGKTAGLIDIYIYSPEGIKFRSRPDVAAYLRKTKSSLKVEDFNFTKRGLTSSVAKSMVEEKQRATSKHRGEMPPKNLPKPKKAMHEGTNNPGKRGQKLLVKLKVGTPKKGAISNSAASSSAKKKSKLAISKPRK